MASAISRKVFVAGGTGYLGRYLIPQLLARGHSVQALARIQSAHRLPSGCEPVMGDALAHTSYQNQINTCDTFVHLVGVAHPNPTKAKQFRTIDLASTQASIAAALSAKVQHFVYVSVAQPAPIMHAYIDARREAESLLKESGLNTTILRPWYVLGPGHRWPYLLMPIFGILKQLPGTRNTARRLDFVKLPQMIAGLIYAIEHPVEGLSVIEIQQLQQIKGAFEMAALA